MFEPKTFDQIFAEMRDRTPPRISDFEEGSVARTFYESFAFELALLYEQMHQVYLSAFVDTATGIQLDRVVAVLGMKRGEPDLASGVVTFARDLGIDEPIEIPLGFLVTTSEDTEETPKKAYQTIETRTLGENETLMQVRVQAVQRGENQATLANTVEVMPQPLPGIKSITNEQPIRFTGKRRETDEELRDRAKTALLAASGGNISAVENALFSLPGVTEVRVLEKFHYARGTVILESSESTDTATERSRSNSTPEITIPKKTALSLQGDDLQEVLTQETVKLQRGRSQAVAVEAVVRGVAGEVPQNAQWRRLQLDTNPAIAIRNQEPILLKDFGVIEVFVDGVDFADITQVRRLEQEIERVRAAGIYVLLKPTRQVLVDGVFLVELKPGQRLSIQERLALEQQLIEALTTHIAEQRMGQPLLISQLTQKLLEPKLVNDLVDFEISTQHSSDATLYDSSTKRLEVEVLEKFVPRYIRVVSEIKPLIVHIQVKVSPLDDNRQRVIEQAIQDYFARLSVRRSVHEPEIRDRIRTAINADVDQLILKPQFWHPAIAFDGSMVNVSLVEQAQLGEIFLYDTYLRISGALKLTLPLTIKENQQQQIQTQVRDRLQTYLDHLKPEEAVDIKQFADIARTVPLVIDVAWQTDDFAVSHPSGAVQNRIDGTIIRVAKFEKAQLAENFAIASSIQTVTVNITQLELGVEITGLIPPATNPEDLQASMQKAIGAALQSLSSQLPQPEIAQSLDYDNWKDVVLLEVIRTAISKLSPATIRTLITKPNLDAEAVGKLADLTNVLLQGAKYTVRRLLLNNATSDIFIRVMERARIEPLNLEQVTIILEMPYPDSSPGGRT